MMDMLIRKEEIQEFMGVFPDIVRDLTEAEEYLDILDVAKWYAKVLQYNVPHGKKIRGLIVVRAYKSIAPKCQQTPENTRLAQIMGWCVEMLQASALVLDDLMDESETRRGRPCWFRHSNNGLMVASDAVLLENGVYVILKKYFSDKPYYVQVLETFHDITLRISMGQTLDMLISKSFETSKLEKFTMDHYKAIVKYKTAYYTYAFPITLAMYMGGMFDPKKHTEMKETLTELGHYFQTQDDYLDCFGDPEVMGKIGTDIQDGKCTWLIVVALQRATPEQRKILEESYGQKDEEKIKAVKKVYKEIGLPSIFAAYEEDEYDLIVHQIQMLPDGLPRSIFFRILNNIYKRQS